MKYNGMMVLKGKDAEKFVKQDHMPLTEAQRWHLERCREIYRANPIK